MSLTPAEAEELRLLEAAEAEEKERLAGAAAVDRARPQPRSGGQTRRFSTSRTVINIFRNTAQGVIDTVDDLGDFLQRKMPLPTVVFGGDAPNKVVGIQSARETTRRTKASDIVRLPTPRGTEQAGTAERVVTGIGEFVVPFMAWRKVLGVTAATSVVGRIGRETAAAAAVDFTQHDPVANNLATILKETFGIDNAVLDSLASEDDDDALEARFKSAAAAAPVGIAADAVLEVGAKGVRMYRDFRSSRDQADGIVDAIRADYSVNARIADLDKAVNEAEAAARAAEPTPAPGTTPGRRAKPKKPSPKEQLATQAAEAQSPEDALAYLRAATGDDVPDDVFADIAVRILDDASGNPLKALGLRPELIDFSILDNPTLIGRFQEDLATVIGKAANRLGRTGTRVTTREIQKAARVLATTDDALIALHGGSKGLAETLMAGRMIVQSQANRVLQREAAALAEITAGPPGAAWEAFATDFTRQAYFQGVVRGASSEVGRALRSLQMRAPTRTKAQQLKGGLEREAAQQAFGPDLLRADAANWLNSATTDAEKIEILKQVREAAGDVGDLTRFVRVKTMTTLKRADLMLREFQVGNVFSSSTAWLNAAAGVTMLGLRASAKFLSALGRAPFGLVSQRQADLARFHLLDAITYTDGIIHGFGESMHNLASLAQREFGAEVALHSNALGFDKLAKRAALTSAKGSAELGTAVYKREDVVTGRFFSFTPAEEHRLANIIRTTDGATFMQQGMLGLAKTLAAVATNTAGGLARAGTFAFISVPDELIGSLAARAGAQSQALRIANEEAVDLGLEGKELWRYLKARSHQLSRHTSGWGDDAYEEGRREAMIAAGVHEAKEVLFQDPLEFAVTRGLQRLHQNTPIVAPLVTLFLKTPLRILERTAIDFTPLGIVKDRMRKAILAGGPERDEALARLALGMTAAVTAFTLADDDRIMVGRDGGYRSSGRIGGRTPVSMRIGDDNLELSRIDPLGILMGFGADLSDTLHAIDDDITRESVFFDVMSAMILATSANVLEKSWMTDMKAMTDLMGATTDEQMNGKLRHFAANYANRAVPGGGIQRSFIRAYDLFVRDSDDFITRVYSTTIGLHTTLPFRRDQLGRPVIRTTMERVVGAPGGPISDDPLDQELEALSFGWSKPKRTVRGVRLNPHQYSRLLELRGQIVRDPGTGLTMEESLRALIEFDEWDTLTPARKVAEIRMATEPFGRLAVDALLEEDKDFARGVLRDEINTEGELEGLSGDDRELLLRAYAQELGLND